MSSTQVDQDAHPSGPRQRRSVVPLALLAVVLLLGWLLLRALPGLPGWPFGSEEVDRTGPVLLTSLTDLEEYHAATGTFQVVVDVERDTGFLPSILSGERTIFLATGEVDAVVDFTGLGSGAVEVSEDGETVTISLPPARLDEADVDLDSSRVLSRDRGVLDRVGGIFSDNPTSEREVTARAEDALDEAAAESDLLERAEENTRDMLTGLGKALGFREVVVEYDAADGL